MNRRPARRGGESTRAERRRRSSFRPPARRLAAAAAAVVLPWFGASPAGAESPLPHVHYVFPAGGRRGGTVEVTAAGTDLEGASAVLVTGRGVTAKLVRPEEPGAGKGARAGKKGDAARAFQTVRISIALAPDAELGERDLRIVTAGGASNRSRFVVGQLPEVGEVEPNSVEGQAQRLDSLPLLVNGQILPGDVDFVRFAARAGQTLVCEVQARALLPYIADAVPGWLQATLTLRDAGGEELQHVDDYRFQPDPVLFFQVPRDGEYVLEIRDALHRGREDMVYRLSIGQRPYLTHVFPLGGRRGTTARLQLYGVNLPADSLDLSLPADAPPVLRVSAEREGLISNALPVAADGLAEALEAEPNDAPGEANRVEPPVVINGRIGERGDADRFTFHMEKGEALVMEVRARRLDSPLDSLLTLHDPKGREIAENDDAVDPGEGLLTHHADSRLEHTAPAAGDYILRLRDVQGQGGDACAYRLRIGRPRPGFALLATPDNPRLARGDSTALTVHAIRRDGFAGPIFLSVGSLPDGFAVSEALVPPGQDHARLTITAPPGAPATTFSLAVAGKAAIDQGEVFREALPAEEIMQAFSSRHRIPTREMLMAVLEATAFTLAAEVPGGGTLELRQGETARVTIRAVRVQNAGGSIKLEADSPQNGLAVRGAVIPAGQNEATLSVTATKKLPAGFRYNLIIVGTLRAGRETFVRTAPAVPIRVLEAKPPETRPAPDPGRRMSL